LAGENEDDKTGGSSTVDTGASSQQTPAPQPDNDANPASSTGDANTASSANEQGEQPKSALEAAQAAIAADDAKKTGTDKDTQTNSEADQDTDPDNGKEPTDDELEAGLDKFGKGAQRRIKTLARRLKERTAEVERFKPGHENFERLQTFVRSNNLVGEEVQQGLTIMALMKNDPVKALQVLEPHLANLRAYVGEILPADLQQQVDAGELTEAHAREIVRNRNEAARNANIANRERQASEQRTQREQLQALQSQMAGALNAYEKELIAADPDYEVKRTRYHDKVKLALITEEPKTVEQVRALAKAQWEAVQNEFKSLGVGKKPATEPVRTDGKTSRSEPAPPKSALEAAKRAVGDA
jgi:hypothetical protein